MDYYAERIAKGGITLAPKLSFEKTGPATGIFHGDNGMGQYVCNEAMKIAIHLAKEAGIAYVGVEQTSHSGTMAYYVKKAAEEDFSVFCRRFSIKRVQISLLLQFYCRRPSVLPDSMASMNASAPRSS